MNDKYFPVTASPLDSEVWEIAHALPAGIGDAFRLVAGHSSEADPANALQAALRHIRGIVGRSYLPRVSAQEILPLSLRLAGYLRGVDGWVREALAALGSAATARAADEGRSALLVAAAAIERGSLELSEAATSAA